MAGRRGIYLLSFRFGRGRVGEISRNYGTTNRRSGRLECRAGICPRNLAGILGYIAGVPSSPSEFSHRIFSPGSSETKASHPLDYEIEMGGWFRILLISWLVFSRPSRRTDVSRNAPAAPDGSMAAMAFRDRGQRYLCRDSSAGMDRHSGARLDRNGSGPHSSSARQSGGVDGRSCDE